MGLRAGAGLEAGTGIYRALGQNYSPRALVVLLLVPILGVDAVPLHLDPHIPQKPRSQFHKVTLQPPSSKASQSKTSMAQSLG